MLREFWCEGPVSQVFRCLAAGVVGRQRLLHSSLCAQPSVRLPWPKRHHLCSDDDPELVKARAVRPETHGESAGEEPRHLGLLTSRPADLPNMLCLCAGEADEVEPQTSPRRGDAGAARRLYLRPRDTACAVSK